MTTREEHTCARCGLTDASVLDLDTGSACHPELRHCIAKLRAAYDALARERDALAKDAELVASGRRDGYALVPVATELLTHEQFTERPLHVMLERHDDGTHSIMFRESEALIAAERERDEYREAHLSAMTAYADLKGERDALRGVVEKARAWMADMWRGDMNGTVIGVCMEYESDGQYVLWEQVAPIVDAVRALDAGGAG